jgi:hypothetical protein
MKHLYKSEYEIMLCSFVKCLCGQTLTNNSFHDKIRFTKEKNQVTCKKCLKILEHEKELK